MTTGIQTFQGSILRLHASIVSFHSPQRIHFDPLKFLNFDFNADPDPAFQSNADPDPASQNYADTDPQPGSNSSTITFSTACLSFNDKLVNYIICFTLLGGYLHHGWNEVLGGRICFQLKRSYFLYDFSLQCDTFCVHVLASWAP